jgi:hypothetical protein
MAAFPITVVAPLKRTMLLAASRRGEIFNAGAVLGEVAGARVGISDPVCRNFLSNVFHIKRLVCGLCMIGSRDTK